MVTTLSRKNSKIIAENNRRIADYFRTYDPIIGDEMGEVVPRVPLPLDGRTYLIPQSMLLDPFINIIIKSKGDLGKVCKALDLPDTHKIHKEIKDMFYEVRMDHDFEFYAAICLTIQDKQTKRAIPFLMNKGQRILVGEFERQRLAGVPIRVIIVKARQWGGSTATEMYMLWLQTRLYLNWHSAIIAKVKSQSANIRGMYTRAVKNLPEFHQKLHIKPWEGQQSVRIIEERGCKIGIYSAEAPDAIRSDDLSMVHMSEVGLWKATKEIKPDDLAQSVYACIPEEPGTFICLESTAKGVGGFFHENYLVALDNAKNNLEGLRPVFVSWFHIKLYTKAIPDVEKFISTMTPYNWWQWEQGATLEGIYWYNNYKRSKKYSDFQMKSEYPTTDMEAFQSASGKYFTEEMLSRLRSGVREPVFIGDIRGDSLIGEKALNNIKLIEDSALMDNLKIWIRPNDYIDPLKEKVSNRFVVTVDIGGTHYKSDNSVISVFDRLSLMDEYGAVERAALWFGHIDHDVLAWKAVQIAKFYNNALLVIESNTIDSRDKKTDEHVYSGDHTYTVLDKIEEAGYDNLYYRRAPSDTAGSPPTRKVGWHMNVKTKYLAYDTYFTKVREAEYIEHSFDAYTEAEYLETVKGKIEAMQGKRDDIQDTTATGVHIAYDFDTMPIPKIIPIVGTRKSKASVGAASF